MQLRKLGQYAPLRVVFNFGVTAGVGSCACPIDDYYEIVEARESHTVLGTDGGAVALTVEKLTGTQAPAGGANMLKTTTFNMKATINTVVTVKSSSLTSLSVAQRAAQFLSPGDRLGCTFSGVLTALAGVVLVVVLRPTRPAGAQAR